MEETAEASLMAPANGPTERNKQPRKKHTAAGKKLLENRNPPTQHQLNAEETCNNALHSILKVARSSQDITTSPTSYSW